MAESGIKEEREIGGTKWLFIKERDLGVVTCISRWRTFGNECPMKRIKVVVYWKGLN